MKCFCFVLGQHVKLQFIGWKEIATLYIHIFFNASLFDIFHQIIGRERNAFIQLIITDYV